MKKCRVVQLEKKNKCLRGHVTDLYATGKILLAHGVVPGNDMTTEAALTKLSYLLSKNMSPDDIRKNIRLNLRGELTVVSK